MPGASSSDLCIRRGICHRYHCSIVHFWCKIRGVHNMRSAPQKDRKARIEDLSPFDSPSGKKQAVELLAISSFWLRVDFQPARLLLEQILVVQLGNRAAIAREIENARWVNRRCGSRF